jgi:hypothetical protein
VPITNIAEHKVYVAQTLLYVVGTNARPRSDKNIHPQRLHWLMISFAWLEKFSAFIVSGFDPDQETACSIQYTLLQSLSIPAFRAAHGNAGTK